MPIHFFKFKKNIENQNQQFPKNQFQPDQVACPSFDEEPWKSKAEKLRPTVLDTYTVTELPKDFITPPPIPLGHPYVKLILEFLDTVPDECWIDEENDVD